jgi:predicted nucleic acid-binding protein
MILLDTNIVSELMRDHADERVIRWVNSVDIDRLFSSSVTVLEITVGLLMLPDGKRRDRLMEEAKLFFDVTIGGRIAEFDRSAAVSAASILADRSRAGITKSLPDTMIAAVAMSRNAAIATRNTRDFRDVGIRVINPFEPA